jgi:hypothetical protein
MAFRSYGRCCNDEAFFEDFYQTLMGKSEAIRAMFINTDMAEQRRLVRAGLMWLIMYAQGSEGSKIEHLTRTHDRHHMNVHPDYYAYWVDSLMETVAQYDPKFDASLENAWRETLRPGIEMMKNGY